MRENRQASGNADIEIISIATDTHPLDGLFYTPRHVPTRAAALLFHGNCHNFYTGPSRFLPEVLTAHGIACLAFNRRGHDMITSLDARNIGGGAFQLAAEAVADNRHAAKWLAARGHRRPILIGHSNGGVLAAQHCADHPDTPALVLLSAHCGGRAITTKLSARGMFGGDQLLELTAQARKLVEQGRPKQLMLLPGWWWAASAECVLDYGENMPDTLLNATKIRCPVLYLRGDQEPEELYPAQAFASLCGPSCDARIIPNCDHFYAGHEPAVATLVADWLRIVP
jgi:pimeloyl-ACP methyl ester carboxylesterase